VVSVKEIEDKSGIDISPTIPDELKSLENDKADYQDWK
jgi:hypothetical protein